MGYQGTLRPVQSQNLPPAMETLLEPWLAQASSRLNQCIPAALRVFQGEPVALDSLLPLLKDRLIGILIQAVGVRGIRPGEPSAEESTREFPLLSALMRSAICGVGRGHRYISSAPASRSIAVGHGAAIGRATAHRIHLRNCIGHAPWRSFRAACLLSRRRLPVLQAASADRGVALA